MGENLSTLFTVAVSSLVIGALAYGLSKIYGALNLGDKNNYRSLFVTTVLVVLALLFWYFYGTSSVGFVGILQDYFGNNLPYTTVVILLGMITFRVMKFFPNLNTSESLLITGMGVFLVISGMTNVPTTVVKDRLQKAEIQGVLMGYSLAKGGVISQQEAVDLLTKTYGQNLEVFMTVVPRDTNMMTGVVVFSNVNTDSVGAMNFIESNAKIIAKSRTKSGGSAGTLFIVIFVGLGGVIFFWYQAKEKAKANAKTKKKESDKDSSGNSGEDGSSPVFGEPTPVPPTEVDDDKESEPEEPKLTVKEIKDMASVLQNNLLVLAGKDKKRVTLVKAYLKTKKSDFLSKKGPSPEDLSLLMDASSDEGKLKALFDQIVGEPEIEGEPIEK